jgi:hypothetical protein
MKLGINVYNDELQIKFEFRRYWSTFDRVTALGLCEYHSILSLAYILFALIIMVMELNSYLIHLGRRMELNGAVLRIGLEKPRPRVTIAGEGLQNVSLNMLGAQGIWAGRDFYSATRAVARGLGFSGLFRRTAPFSRLFGHTRGCGGSILTRILTGLIQN